MIEMIIDDSIYQYFTGHMSYVCKSYNTGKSALPDI